MKTGTVLGIAAALLLTVGGVAFGMWLKKPTIDDLVEHNRRLSAMDTLKTVQLDNERIAYSVLVDDFANAKDAWGFIEDSLTDVSVALGKKVRDQGNEITTLAQANAVLRDSAEVDVGEIDVTAESVTAELFTYKGYQDGSISAEGDITIFTPEDDEPYGSASLYFDIQMQPSVILGRDEMGLATCDLSFGDMPIYLSDLVCIDNMGYEPPVRSEINWPTVGITAGVVVLGLVVLASVL